MWPFTSKQIEDRASYTDAALLAAIGEASNARIKPESIAAAEIAASCFARALAVARVEPKHPATAALTPRILWDIGRHLILYGESLHVISLADVDGSSQVKLTIARQGWDIVGRPDESTWRYALALAGPSEQLEMNYPSDAVLHCRYSIDHDQPHKGIGPFDAASTTARLGSALENQLSDEAAAPSGHVLPVPSDQYSSGSDALVNLRNRLKGLKGRTAIVPSQKTSFGDGGNGRTEAWQPKRLGFEPPDAVATVRLHTIQAMLSAAGVPPELWSVGNVSASGRREAFRQFLFGTVQPVADTLLVELRAKLHPDITFDFERLFAADVQGRARAFKSFVDGGMDVEKAARLSGVLSEADE